uniref:V-SNARE coiled-coil homology domain-containing protein n=1 Tax=Craspedostauros australis TaxID=1486917 RepID=A0A7R9ZLP6_9STRA|mmetsp:Transcript_14883/g.41221  ORF Transcript_14883/g.41221 Transcript_14883/m.41221 type:complete len:223 (+) Transcript_14883:227-895(+)
MPPLMTQVARLSDGLPLVATQTPSPGYAVTNAHQKEAKEILRKLTHGTPNKMSIVSGDRVFYYMSRDTLCFLVMTESRYPKRLSFLYMDEVADLILNELVGEFGNAWRAEIDTTERPFRFIHYDPVVQRKQREFQDERQQKSKLSDDLNEIQNIMKKNINDILDRGEKLDNVQNISKDLLKQSSGFKWGARKLTWQARGQQFAPMVLGFGVLIFVVYVKVFW